MPYVLLGFVTVLLAGVTLLDKNGTVEPRNDKFNETPRGFLYANQFSPKFNLK